ncbi:hypothetical protein C8D98_1088 [Seleniivibrio woodruffii]|uniref:Uncharacterized protein n=1 Tax=Seleniivibrio woodruffii TaxID=1078050 RepID=A0A4R1KGT1_9BACT|nr:hypothetical protein C8D98_1088 [Seleniivibrio woodruffii]
MSVIFLIAAAAVIVFRTAKTAERLFDEIADTVKVI